MAKPVEHRFGGRWTELKLSAVRYYLDFYATALSKQPFDLWYIDAFAGTGDRTETQFAGGLFEQTPITLEDVTLDGSARRAMAVKPPFKNLIFMEPDPARYAALCGLKDRDPRVQCLKGDANELLPQIFATPEWRRTGQRGVVFLDPYGMQVSWDTLEVLARTRRVDVWYLFPLGAVNRQLARDAAGIDKHKAAALNRVFGGEAWRTDLYAPKAATGLFDIPDVEGRTVSIEAVESYFHGRLSELFSWTSPSLPLFLDGGQQVFSLFLCIANDRPAAVQLAKNGMRDLLKQHGRQAYRRTSGP